MEIVLMVEDLAAVHAQASASVDNVSLLVKQPWGFTDFASVTPTATTSV